MKITLYLALMISIVFCSCDDRVRRRNTDTSCADPIADYNPNLIRFQNMDQRSLFLAFGSLSSGDQSSNLNARAEIAPGSTINLPFSNQGFNQYYVYRDPNLQQLVASLIIRNTQPNYVCIATIQLTADGNFRPSDLKVTNLRNSIVIREITMPAWQNWDGEIPSTGSRHELNECVSTSFRTTAYNDFRHLYFYQQFSGGTSYPFSQVIYRNTNTSKIQFTSIIVK